MTQQAVGARTPIFLVVLSMDYCSRTFGTSPCLATGEKCFNTYPTCKYKSAYLNVGKDYKFTSANAAAPFDLARPYLKTVRLLPTEIKDKYTVAGRVTVEMYDEPDGDVGIDPYVTGRSTFPNIPGTFWKKWLVRNANYKGRRIKVYEGWAGETEGEYDLRWVGKLETVTCDRGVVRFEASDLLKNLSTIYVPQKVDVKLRANVTETETTLYVTINSGLDSPSGTIRIGDEIMTYTGIDLAGGLVTGVSRGQYATTADSHNAREKVQKCRVYAKQNPFDLLKSLLLTDAGMPAADVDSTAFDYWKAYPATDLDVGPVVISEPAKLSDFYAELLELVNAKSWQNEANKITVYRDIASVPLSPVAALSDAETIENGSVKTDLNEKSRLTRVWLYWDKDMIGKFSEDATYARTDVAVATESESAVSFGEIVERKIVSQFLVSAGQVEEPVAAFSRNVVFRVMARHVEASPIISIRTDLKDEALKTGDMVSLLTDEVVDALGNSTNAVWQVVRREKQDTKVALSLLRASSRKIAHAAASGYAYDYSTAPAADKLKYGFAAASGGLMSNYDQGFFAY